MHYRMRALCLTCCLILILFSTHHLSANHTVHALKMAVAPPVVSDTSFCGPGTYTVSAQKEAGSIVIWYDAPAGGNILGSGDQLSLNLAASTTVYAEAGQLNVPRAMGLDDPFANGGNYFPISNERGLVFDVREPLRLDTVSIYANGPLTGTVFVRNAAGQVLFQQAVSLSNSGANPLPIGLMLEVGSGYRLTLANPSGANLFVNTSIAYPLDYGQLSITGGHTVATHYNYFFDWKVTVLDSARSDRSPLNVTIKPAPQISFGDTAVCSSSFELNAGNAGATFLWNTGATSQSIMIENTDYYEVSVDIDGCTATFGGIVDLVPMPSLPVSSDTVLCGSQDYTLSAQTDGDVLLWYDVPTGGQPIHSGPSLSKFFQDSETFYLQAANYLDKRLGRRVGLPDPFQHAGGYFPVPSTRGLFFDVHEPFILDSLTIYTQGTLRTFVEIRDSGRQLVFRRFIETNASGPTVIPIGYELQVGTHYSIEVVNPRLDLYINTSGVSFPLVYEQLSITGGTTVGAHYNFFYDWQITVLSECRSQRKSSSVTVRLPSVLPDSLYTCESAVLDAGPGPVSYLWSTGETSQSIVVDSAGIYTVELSDGENCTFNESVKVAMPMPVALGQDGVLCGQVLHSGYEEPAQIQWSTGATTPDIQISQPGTYSVQVQEPNGCLVSDTITVTGFAPFPEVDLGADFIACGGATLDAGNPGHSYQWSTGDTSQSIAISSSGAYWVAVTNDNQCTSRDTVSVNVIKLPTAFFGFSTDGLNLFTSNLSSFGSYLWNFGDGTVSTQISPTHTYVASGTYTVSLIVSNSCGSDTFMQEVMVIAVGIEEEVQGPQLTLYPVPAQKEVQLRAEGLQAGIYTFSVTNIFGRRLYLRQEYVGSSRFELRFELRGLPAGVYLLTIAGKTGTYTCKFIKG
ncbi:MAG: T9SS C-terminal target domain-containing protein [Bacteroidetes bacterium]|nr:MAG: T9SS C-terminal target domain-containing protein [Bacteroidota bacterium]